MNLKTQLNQLSEVSWGQPEPEEPEVQGSASDIALSAFGNLDLLNKLDQNFDSLYKNITQNDNEELKLFSSKMQKLELGKFANEVSRRTSQTAPSNIQTDIDQLMNSDVDDILKIFNDDNIQNNRKKLYELYAEISNINPIAYRMLQVYINNILVKNMQTKQFINIVENDVNPQVKVLDKEVIEHIKKFIKMIILYFDVQVKLKNKIIPETLKFGDYYMEIVDLEKVDDILEKKVTILQESCEHVESQKNVLADLAYFEDYSEIDTKTIVEGEALEESYTFEKGDFDEQMRSLLKNKRGLLSLDEADVNYWNDVMKDGQDFDINNFSELDFDKIEDIYLRLIEPSQVLKIEKDGHHYGYLVIEDLEKGEDPDNEINLYQRFLRDDNDGSNQKDVGKQENLLADKIVDGISNKLSELITHDVGFLSEIPDELKSSLRIIAYEKIRKKTKLKFRFLQPDKLINFHTNIDKYGPYGTSIFDPIIVPVKMYTIATMSSVISRLSRAAVIRKWNIEVGTKRNYPEMVEKVKKDLRSKSISYDNLSSIKNISQVMTDFRDVAVISQNGQKFIDMEIMPMQDRALPLNDLQDLRNELVAATGIPSVYLNIGDAIELRETLVNLNIGFANTISTYQSYFEDSLNKLLNSIFDIILKKNDYNTDFKISQFFKLTMNAPLVLQLQNNEATITTIGNIIGLLEQAKVQVSPIELFKMYAPNVDWDQLTSTGEDAIKDEIKDNLIRGNSGGGGAGF